MSQCILYINTTFSVLLFAASRLIEISNADSRDQVREMLAKTFGKSSPEDLCRVLFSLDRHDDASGDGDGTALSPHWKRLKALMNSDREFNNFAQRLVDDTKTAEEDKQFRRVMHDVYENLMIYLEKHLPTELQGFDVTVELSGFAGLARAWGKMPPCTKIQILTNINAISSSGSVVSKPEFKVVMSGLAPVHLSSEAYNNIKRWWRGEISGERCAKNVIDAMVTTAAGVGGGLSGAVLGATVAGPIGAVVGGVVGWTVSSNLANILSDRLTLWVFGVPKSEALENAYNYLQVKPNATNAEVNKAFRKMCLKHHPDKGGTSEEFLILQNYMAVIRMAREYH